MKKDTKNYFITLISKSSDTSPISNPIADSRCIGYYTTYQQAHRALLNDPSLGDPCWNYAVIEEISDGCYMYRTKEFWYKMTYNKKKETYKIVDIKKPKCYAHICSFGIG